MSIIFQTESSLTLAGGAGFSRAELDAARALGPELIAADGGADHLDRLGVAPSLVLGDLDSITPALRARLGDRVCHIPDQDSTDLDKCLRSLRAPMVFGIGFLGARLDHTAAAMTALVRHGSARVVLIGPEDVCFLAPPMLELPISPGERVSLFPMAPVTGRSVGLKWPIDGIDFSPQDVIGTSNRANHDRMVLKMDAPAMLIMLPVAMLPDVARALQGAPDWPAQPTRR